MKKSFFLIIAPSLMFFTLSFIIKNESHSSSKVDKRKNQMNEKIEAIMLNSENFCFTRFTISIPSKSEISFGRMTVNSKIKRVPNEIENFYEIINGEIRNNQDNYYDAVDLGISFKVYKFKFSNVWIFRCSLFSIFIKVGK